MWGSLPLQSFLTPRSVHLSCSIADTVATVLKLVFVRRVRPAPGDHPPRWAVVPGAGVGSTGEGAHNLEHWGGSLKEGGWSLKIRQTKVGG